MKIIEVLKSNKELLSLLQQNDVDVGDIDYIPIVEAYIDMKCRGFKVTFIVEYLSDKHRVSVANIYRAVKRLNADVVM